MEQADTERFELEEAISQFLTASFIELDESERQLMKRFGLTLTQYWALVHLDDEEGRSLSELADLLICDKSNVTSIVDRFEEIGLAERKRGKEGDRRYIRVVISERGRQLRTLLMSTRTHLLRQRFQALDTEVLQQLREPLQQLTSILQAQFKHKEVPDMITNAVEQTHADQEVAAILA